MLRPLLNAAYWAQVQSKTEKERRQFDRYLEAPVVPAARDGRPTLAPEAQILLGMMKG